MFIQRMTELMKQKKITNKKISQDLGFGINQIKYWKKHNNVPNAETVSKIAEYLDPTPEYLLGKTEKNELDEKHPLSHKLSNNNRIINLYQSLPSDKKTTSIGIS